MGLFGGFQNAGPGINPYAPKKKPFFRYWELMWRNLSKLLGLNMIFVLCHIPLFSSLIVYMGTNNGLTTGITIGLLILQLLLEGPIIAGTTRVLRLIVLDKAFFMGEEFKKGFSRNLGASLLIWLIDAIVMLSIYYGSQIYPQLAERYNTNAVYVPYVISLAVGFVLLFMNFYLMPLTVVTKLKLKSVFKNSFMLTVLSPKQCLLSTACILLYGGSMVLLFMFSSYFMFLLAFYPFAIIGYTVMFINYPVIQKFVINPYYEETGEQNPEEEELPPEEERVFTDRGGTEKPIQKQKAKKGKIIS